MGCNCFLFLHFSRQANRQFVERWERKVLTGLKASNFLIIAFSIFLSIARTLVEEIKNSLSILKIIWLNILLYFRASKPPWTVPCFPSFHNRKESFHQEELSIPAQTRHIHSEILKLKWSLMNSGKGQRIFRLTIFPVLFSPWTFFFQAQDWFHFAVRFNIVQPKGQTDKHCIAKRPRLNQLQCCLEGYVMNKAA